MIVVAFSLFFVISGTDLARQVQANRVALTVMQSANLRTDGGLLGEGNLCSERETADGKEICTYNIEGVLQSFRRTRAELCGGADTSHQVMPGEIANLCQSGRLVLLFIQGITSDEVSQLRLTADIANASQTAGDSDIALQASFAFWSSLLDVLNNDSNDALTGILCDDTIFTFVEQGEEVWQQDNLEAFAQIVLQRLPAGQCRTRLVEWAYGQGPSPLLQALRIEDMRRSQQWPLALQHYQALLTSDSSSATPFRLTRYVFAIASDSVHGVDTQLLAFEPFPANAYCAPYDVAQLDVWLALRLLEIYRELGHDVNGIEADIINYLDEGFTVKGTQLAWGRRIQDDWALEGLAFPAGYTNWYDEVPVLISLFQVNENGARVNDEVRLVWLRSIIDNPDFDWTLTVGETDEIIGFDRDVYPGSRFRSQITEEVVNGRKNHYLTLQNSSTPMLTGLKTQPFTWPTDTKYINIVCVKTDSLQNVVAAPAWTLPDSDKVVIDFHRPDIFRITNDWRPIMNIFQSPEGLEYGAYWLVNSGMGGVGFDHVLLAEFTIVN